jgi:tRNA threonylcarbamoyl adenosine modification protein (Sua5/YciO/YrdC/YwlC family)
MEGQFAKACAALRRGEAVAFPTDTVYGIGVAVREGASPETLYRIKGRDPNKAIPLLIGDASELPRYARDLPAYALGLAQRHWPGALTLVVYASDAIPPAFQAADSSCALRVCSHPLVLRLIKAIGMPIATTSANMSGEEPVTDAAKLDARIVEQVSLVLDCNDAAANKGGGLASTVVSCLGGRPVVLRQGAVRLCENAQDRHSELDSESQIAGLRDCW